MVLCIFLSDENLYATGNTLIVIDDFIAKTESELSVRKGDRLEVVDKG